MTALEVFRLIDPTNYNLFIEEVKLQKRENKIKSNFHSIYGIIFVGLVWAKTRQGRDFWERVATSFGNIKLENNKQINYYI